MFKLNAVKNKVAGFVGVCLLSMVVMADELALAPGHPDSYVVKKGDTLWDISGKFLEKPWLWPEIWHNNPDIANPHLIYPGDTLRLVNIGGKTKLMVERGEAGNTMKMSPDCPAGKLCPAVRVESLEPPIPAIPLDVIDPFLTGTRIVASGALEDAPYVLMGSQQHVVTGAGDLINARGEFDTAVPIYGIFRKGKVYTDDETGELLGVQAIDIGSARVKNAEGDIAQLSVLRSTQHVAINDRLLPNEERRIQSIFYPASPQADIKGSIIDVEGGVSQIGKMNVVVIDRGEREGLEIGNILAIYQRGETVKDTNINEWVKLPDERAGLLMVFNVFEKTSFGLVLQVDRPLTVGSVVRNP